MNSGLIKKLLASAFSLSIICGFFGPAMLPSEVVNADTIVVPIDSKHFPDKVFRRYVSEFFDHNKDKKLNANEIMDVEWIEIVDSDISTLKGIEYFPSLIELSVELNKITKLDLSKNTNLEYLCVMGNELTSLDLSKNVKLGTLDCAGNQLTSLNVRKCKSLLSIDCSGNKLSKLDVSECKSLGDLECANNKFKELDISQNRELRCLDCSRNDIATLDISGCPKLITEFNKGINASATKYWCDANGTKDLKAYQTYEDRGNFLVVPKKTKVERGYKTVSLWQDQKNEAIVVCGSKLELHLEGYDSGSVTWKSSNTDVASVDPDGIVTGKQAGNVVITAKFYKTTVKCNLLVQYKDVTKKSAFWYTPTYDLTAKDVVKGYDKQTAFKPANDCTRAQMVTFLWRLSGCPKPKASTTSFKDIKKSDYFYKPVLWAVENGITTGISKTKFAPSGVCTRAQTVTFLWRMAGKPEPSSAKNKFSDIKKSDYFYTATIWASGKKIVAGYNDGTFKPQGKCLRRQMVTFLYKYNEFVNKKSAEPTKAPAPTKAPVPTATPTPKPTSTPTPTPAGWGFGDNRDRMSASQKATYDKLIADGYVYGVDFTVDNSGKIVYGS